MTARTEGVIETQCFSRAHCTGGGRMKQGASTLLQGKRKRLAMPKREGGNAMISLRTRPRGAPIRAWQRDVVSKRSRPILAVASH